MTSQRGAGLQGSHATSPTREEHDRPELLVRERGAPTYAPDPGRGLRQERIPILPSPVTTELARRSPHLGAESCTEESVR